MANTAQKMSEDLNESPILHTSGGEMPDVEADSSSHVSNVTQIGQRIKDAVPSVDTMMSTVRSRMPSRTVSLSIIGACATAIGLYLMRDRLSPLVSQLRSRVRGRMSGPVRGSIDADRQDQLRTDVSSDDAPEFVAVDTVVISSDRGF